MSANGIQNADVERGSVMRKSPDDYASAIEQKKGGHRSEIPMTRDKTSMNRLPVLRVPDSTTMLWARKLC